MTLNDLKKFVKFDFYYPIFENLGSSSITLDMIYNPYYPDHVKLLCKASRKRIFKRCK